MHPYLTRLGVRPEVQAFFVSSYRSDKTGNLVFPYGDAMEHFGFAFHRVPVSAQFWTAGESNFHLIRQVFICASAMEAIAYLQLHFQAFAHLDGLLFLATGAGLSAGHISFIREHLTGKSILLVFGKDLLGRITCLKLAALIREKPISLRLSEKKGVLARFRLKDYFFQQEEFCLTAFEKAAKYWFHIPCPKPKSFDSFFDQLKAQAFLNL